MSIALAPFTIRYNVHNQRMVEEAYSKLQALGFSGIEGGMGRGHGLEPKADNDLAAKYGIKVIDIWGDPNRPDDMMKTADAYGTKYVCVSTMPGNMMLNPDGFKAYAENLNRWAIPFAKAGYKLSYHNHAQEFRNFAALGGKTGFEILLEETDPDNIHICLDTFWVSAAGGDPVYWLKKLKGRATIVHFKEYSIDERSYDVDMGNIPFRFAEVGQGNINWLAVVEACREIGIEWYCIEQDFTRGDAFDSLKISIDFMKNTLKI
jgi:sugar phosphate isomerase/epimerase